MFETETPGPAILCEGLVVAYDDFVAVDGLDLEIQRGECFGLLGPNGAGKTTAVEVFEGLLKPRAGTVRILGEVWGGGAAADRRLRHRIGVALQETRLPDKLTVAETLRLFRSFFDEGQDIDELIALLDLEEKRKARVMALSGGQRQRLVVACALVGKPELLFLDEPTTGLDPHARQGIWRVIESHKRAGCTVVLTTHYMEEAARLCDRIAIMDHGKRIALDTPGGLVHLLAAEEIVEVELEGEPDEGLLASLPGVRRVEKRGARWALMVDSSAKVLPALVTTLAARGLVLRGVTTHEATLDDVFVHLTGKRLSDG